MPQTIEELGRKWKAKYPGAYDDLSDTETGQKVKAKFPGAYDDFTDQPAKPPGFGERLYQSTVGPLVETVKHPVTAATETAKTVFGIPQLQEIGRQIQAGNWGAATAGILDYGQKGAQGRMAEQMTAPIIEDVRTGNYGGAAGGLVGTGLSLLGPEVLPKALPRLPGRGTIRAGERPSVTSKLHFELPEAAAGKLQSQLEAGVRETPWSSLDDVKTAAKAGDANATEVLRQIENAGDVPGRIEQASINLEDFRSSQEADRLYSSVDEAAKKAGLGNIPLTRSSVVLDKALEGLAAAKVRDPALISLLEGIRKRITPATRIQAGNTYGLMRGLVSDLGERIRAKHTGENALIGEKGVAQLQMLKDAIESDIQTWTAKSGVP